MVSEHAHLRQAERHIALGERLVEDQRRRLDGLIRSGYDSAAAQHFLATLESALAMMYEHRRAIISMIAAGRH
jgi:hypothetical protein